MSDSTTPLGPLLSRRRLGQILGVSPSDLDKIAGEAEQLYAPFWRKKRTGLGRTRRIDNPQDPLKKIQKRINQRILRTFTFPEFVTGGVRGRSALGNAAQHVGKRLVVAIDLRDFFGTVSSDRVYAMWRREFGASSRVARLLVALTTFDGRLAQGSPASNTIANIVALPLARELSAMCEAQGIRFSIYVDDMTFSGRHVRNALPSIFEAIRKHGFSVRKQKVQVMPSFRSQKVTGAIVNRLRSNGNKRLRALRSRLVQARHAPPSPSALTQLEGLVAHAARTNPAQGRRLLMLLQTMGPLD